MNPEFWRGKRVFVTGHTGFKGGWLCLWLHALGARVFGYALEPAARSNLYEAANVASVMESSVVADVRELAVLKGALQRAKPQIVIHMAAQSLVRESYVDPVGTYSTNVMGTVNLLEAAREAEAARVILIVTSDKCYENRERMQGYREDEAMGGHDPYSSSKGCAELVTAAYSRSFFAQPGARVVASARSGNVIGGGDWSKDRLVPDAMHAFIAGKTLKVRNPDAIRPWQHVLDPLHGYLTLVEHLWADGAAYSGAWNFGPSEDDVRPVKWIVEQFAERLGGDVTWELDAARHPHEAGLLKLDCSKAIERLGWQPRLRLESALDWVIDWYRGYATSNRAAGELTQAQILRYQNELRK
jgi:CDP-glucose 4,6-dehydratase